jgi:prevent-host-death family protein
MIQSTISNTKNHLSELLQKVRSGETLVILDRNQPVAKVLGLTSAEGNPHLEFAEHPLDVEAFLNMPTIHAREDSGVLTQALVAERNSGW